MTLDCDSVLCTSWRPKSAAKARAEISQQEKFISFFKVGVMGRVMAGRDTASLEEGAGARAADANVDDLSEIIRSLDKVSDQSCKLAPTTGSTRYTTTDRLAHPQSRALRQRHVERGVPEDTRDR